MPSTWQLATAELCCTVEHHNSQLLWQIEHPDAPGGRTRLTPVGDITIRHEPVRWATLIGAETGSGPDGAPRLAVTLEDETGRLRLVQHFELFQDHPFVRIWGSVQRTGTAQADEEPQMIDGAAILHLTIDKSDGGSNAAPITLLHVHKL